MRDVCVRYPTASLSREIPVCTRERAFSTRRACIAPRAIVSRKFSLFGRRVETACSMRMRARMFTRFGNLYPAFKRLRLRDVARIFSFSSARQVGG